MTDDYKSKKGRYYSILQPRIRAYRQVIHKGLKLGL